MYDRYDISPDRIAYVVAFAIDQPEDTTINEFTVVRPSSPCKDGDDEVRAEVMDWLQEIEVIEF